jgi:hypothetical protein
MVMPEAVTYRERSGAIGQNNLEANIDRIEETPSMANVYNEIEAKDKMREIMNKRKEIRGENLAAIPTSKLKGLKGRTRKVYNNRRLAPESENKGKKLTRRVLINNGNNASMGIPITSKAVSVIKKNNTVNDVAFSPTPSRKTSDISKAAKAAEEMQDIMGDDSVQK